MAKAKRSIRDIIEARDRVADVGSLADEFLDKFGGISGLIKEMKIVYDSARDSDKTKILLSGVELIKEAADKKAGTDDVASMSTEELASAARVLGLGITNELSDGAGGNLRPSAERRASDDPEVDADE